MVDKGVYQLWVLLKLLLENLCQIVYEQLYFVVLVDVEVIGQELEFDCQNSDMVYFQMKGEDVEVFDQQGVFDLLKYYLLKE